jgi:hypothetical protein
MGQTGASDMNRYRLTISWEVEAENAKSAIDLGQVDVPDKAEQIHLDIKRIPI